MSEQFNVEVFFSQLYRSTLHNITEPFIADGTQYNLSAPPQFNTSLGQQICILDVDTRPNDKPNQLWSEDHPFDWTKVEGQTPGLLSHYLYGKPDLPAILLTARPAAHKFIYPIKYSMLRYHSQNPRVQISLLPGESLPRSQPRMGPSPGHCVFSYRVQNSGLHGLRCNFSTHEPANRVVDELLEHNTRYCNGNGPRTISMAS